LQNNYGKTVAGILASLSPAIGVNIAPITKASLLAVSTSASEAAKSITLHKKRTAPAGQWGCGGTSAGRH
jgi:ABC-type amino acid transport system permease subunit